MYESLWDFTDLWVTVCNFPQTDLMDGFTSSYGVQGIMHLWVIKDMGYEDFDCTIIRNVCRIIVTFAGSFLPEVRQLYYGFSSWSAFLLEQICL